MGKIKKLFFYFFAIVLGFFGKPIFAFAILDIFTEPVKFIIRLAAGAGLLILVSFLFLGVSNAIIGWVTMPNFVTVSYTRPDNLIVQYGWTTVRDFTNLLFILVLVVIGIATALRIREYEVKRTIPRLIAVALLINFTPIVCGAIIDASNILMNFFLSAGSGGYSTMINVLSNSANILISTIINFDVRNLFNGVLLFQALFLVAFNFIAGFVLLLFAVLLLLRHVALWILVILSPLAFFCWILPGTKSIWNKWWNQFIQWCFVGVGGAFFIYLSQVVTQNATAGNLFAKPGEMIAVGSPTLRNQISEALVFSVPLILLSIGAFTTMSTSAMGANIITKKAGQMLNWGKGKAGGYARSTWQGFKDAGKPIKGRVEGAARRRIDTIRQRMEGAHWGKDQAGVKGKAKRVGAWTFRKIGEIIGEEMVPQNIAAKAKATEEGKKIEDKYTFKKEMEKAAGNIAKEIGLIEGALKSGKLKDFMKEGAIDQNKIDRAFEDSVKFGFKDSTKAFNKYFSGDDNVLRKFASIQDKVTANMTEEKRTTAGLTQEDVQKGYSSYKDKVLAESLNKREDFENLAESLNKMPAAEKQKTMEHMVDMAERGLFGKEQIGHAGRVMGEEFVSVFENRLQENLNKDELFYHKLDQNSGKSRAWIARFAATNPVARELGITLPENISKNLNKYESFSRDAEHSVRQFSLESANSMARPLADLNLAIRDAQGKQNNKDAFPNLSEEERQHEAVREKILSSAYGAIENKGIRASERIKNLDEIGDIIDAENTAVRKFAEESSARESLENIRTASKARRERLSHP